MRFDHQKIMEQRRNGQRMGRKAGDRKHKCKPDRFHVRLSANRSKLFFIRTLNPKTLLSQRFGTEGRRSAWMQMRTGTRVDLPDPVAACTKQMSELSKTLKKSSCLSHTGRSSQVSQGPRCRLIRGAFAPANSRAQDSCSEPRCRDDRSDPR